VPVAPAPAAAPAAAPAVAPAVAAAAPALAAPAAAHRAPSVEQTHPLAAYSPTRASARHALHRKAQAIAKVAAAKQAKAKAAHHSKDYKPLPVTWKSSGKALRRWADWKRNSKAKAAPAAAPAAAAAAAAPAAAPAVVPAK